MSSYVNDMFLVNVLRVHLRTYLGTNNTVVILIMIILQIFNHAFIRSYVKEFFLSVNYQNYVSVVGKWNILSYKQALSLKSQNYTQNIRDLNR